MPCSGDRRSLIWQGCAKSACACKKCDLRFCARCLNTPKPQVAPPSLLPAALFLCSQRFFICDRVVQEWWNKQDDLKVGTDGKLISACCGCFGVFCPKKGCAPTTCSECSHISCKECDEAYVCGDCGEAWCVRCRDRTRCANCNFQVTPPSESLSIRNMTTCMMRLQSDRSYVI